MGRKVKVRPDHRADTRGGQFAGLPHVVLDSPAYRHLSLWARAVLIELVRRFNGYNNGTIALSQRELAQALNTTNFRKITAALAELLAHGLIDVPIGARPWQERKAREYRLTFVSTGTRLQPVPASNEYREWRPASKQTGADGVSARRANSADGASAAKGMAADDVSARIRRKPQISVASAASTADDVSALIVMPSPGPADQGQNIEQNGVLLARDPDDLRRQARQLRKVNGDAALADAAGVTLDSLIGFIDRREQLPPASMARLIRGLSRLQAAA